MPSKSIFFDLDGTLTDSGPGIMNCAKMTLEHYGIPVSDMSVLRTVVGPPLDQSFRRFGIPEENIEEAIKVYRSRYLTVGMYENNPYPGIEELLQKLQKDGFDLYVATSKPETTSVQILEHFGLAKFFTRICGAAMDLSRNSKESVIAYLLETCGTAGSAVMVGDTAYDVIGAKAHGIPTIGVSWGYGLVEDMQKSGAVAIAENVSELYDLLTE